MARVSKEQRGVVAEVLAGPYARVLLRDEDGYGAKVLEFPGCFAGGATPDAAIANLDAAVEDWVLASLEAGQSIPPPIAATAYGGRLSLRIPPELHRRVTELATAEGVSVNRWLADAVARAAGEEVGAATGMAAVLAKAAPDVRTIYREPGSGVVRAVAEVGGDSA